MIVGKAAALHATVACPAAVRVIQIYRFKVSPGSASGDIQCLRKISRPLQRGRHVPQACPGDRLQPPFEADQEEALVADDRAAQRAAKLVAPQPQPLFVEEAARVQHLVAQVLKRRAMELIRPGTHRDADNAARKAAVFGREARSDYAELLDCVQRWPHLRPAADRIAVADAIDVEISLITAGAIDRREGSLPAPAGHHAGHQEREVGEIAALQRQVLDLFVDDHIAFDRAALEIDRRSGRADRHRLGDCADLERYIDAQLLSRLQLKVSANEAGEPIGFHGEFIRTRNQADQGIVARFVRPHLRLDPGFDVLDGNVRTGNHGVCRVGHDAGHASQAHLGLRGHGHGERKQPKPNRTAEISSHDFTPPAVS